MRHLSDTTTHVRGYVKSCPRTRAPSRRDSGYTDFLLRTAALGDSGELVAALLPCMWGYSELGQGLAQTHFRGSSRPPRGTVCGGRTG